MNESTPRKPLRLWPGVAIAIAQVLVMFGAPVVMPDAELPIGMFGGMVGALLIFLWWLTFSRARWFERVGAIVLAIVAVFAVRSIAHESITGLGQEMAIYFLPVPYLALALVAWAVATRSLQGGIRLAMLTAALLLAAMPFALIRTSGVMGGAGFVFHLRWTPTPEERLLAHVSDEPKPLPPSEIGSGGPEDVESGGPTEGLASTGERNVPAPASIGEKPTASVTETAPSVAPPSAKTPAEWPGFRGPNRDGVVRAAGITIDWSASPPVEVWRRPIGPGWSSFAVQGDLLYTQEQRGEEEIVSCYRVSTGEPVWRHRDPVRFWESNGGAGPRATPTLRDGRVYTSGATGILNALDARTGAVLWSHNVSAEAKVDTPIWGFSASPLVIDDVVIAAASGALAAYDRVTGAPRWLNSSRGGSYSSPHRMTIDSVEQVVLLGGPGVLSVAPADGKLLWEHKFEGGAIVQPGVIDDGDIVVNAISAMGGIATRRLHVSRANGAWTAEERWTSRGLKPYFNDFVIHEGHAYGFDGSILASISLEDGNRNWKGGRYGNGQMLLLPDQDLLLVLSEEGELALVSATTDGFKELARMPALNAKTWNHPVLIGDLLLIRNGEEMAAYRLPMERAGSTTAR